MPKHITMILSACIVLGASVTAESAQLRLKSGRILRDPVITSGSGTTINLKHASGGGMYDIRDFALASKDEVISRAGEHGINLDRLNGSFLGGQPPRPTPQKTSGFGGSPQRRGGDEPQGEQYEVVMVRAVGRDRSDAKKNAFNQAVQQVVGVLVDSHVVVENDELIKNAILLYSDGYIDNYKVISEGEARSGYSFNAQIWVRRTKLLSSLMESRLETKDGIRGDLLRAETESRLKADEQCVAMLKRLICEDPRRYRCGQLSITPIHQDQLSDDEVRQGGAVWCTVKCTVTADPAFFENTTVPKLHRVLKERALGVYTSRIKSGSSADTQLPVEAHHGLQMPVMPRMAEYETRSFSRCNKCYGRGSLTTRCGQCNGTGRGDRRQERVRCSGCQGSGYKRGLSRGNGRYLPFPCSACNRQGYFNRTIIDPGRGVGTCSGCSGRRSLTQKCSACGGDGQVTHVRRDNTAYLAEIARVKKQTEAVELRIKEYLLSNAKSLPIRSASISRYPSVFGKHIAALSHAADSKGCIIQLFTRDEATSYHLSPYLGSALAAALEDMRRPKTMRLEIRLLDARGATISTLTGSLPFSPHWSTAPGSGSTSRDLSTKMLFGEGLHVSAATGAAGGSLAVTTAVDFLYRFPMTYDELQRFDTIKAEIKVD